MLSRKHSVLNAIFLHYCISDIPENIMETVVLQILCVSAIEQKLFFGITIGQQAVLSLKKYIRIYFQPHFYY